MTKPVKITIITLSVLFLLLIICYFIASSVITSKIEQALKNELPENLTVNYKDLDLNLWGGNLILTAPQIVKKGAHTLENTLTVDLDTVMLTGFGYWDYFKNDNLTIENIQLKSPKVNYTHNKAIPKEAYRTSGKGTIKNRLKIDQFNIENATLMMREAETDSLLMSAERLNVNVKEVAVDSLTASQNMPFIYGDYEISVSNFKSLLGDFEKIAVGSMELTNDHITVSELHLYTKYSKPVFDQMLTKERDHYNVLIKSIALKEHSYGFIEDSLFYFISPQVQLDAPELYIYRNKLITDDLTRKPMYSKMLRDLGFSLTLNEVILNDAVIEYSEKVNADMVPGKIAFSKLDATIKNISNTYTAPEKTELDIKAIFMAKTPIEVNWNFDVNDVNDGFVFKAHIGHLPAPDLNPFSQPNLKVLLKGDLLKTYATISGDANTSQIHMRTNYEDFKVEILDKEGEKKKTILSALANLFIKKSSDNSEDGFRESFKDQIERDKTKSIFNFLWLNLKAGLVSVMTGNGKV